MIIWSLERASVVVSVVLSAWRVCDALVVAALDWQVRVLVGDGDLISPRASVYLGKLEFRLNQSTTDCMRFGHSSRANITKTASFIE